MRESYRKIADFMDSVEHPLELSRILHIHRNPQPIRDFREIWNRHNDENAFEQKFIFLNTYLMDIAIDKVIGDNTRGTKPRVGERSHEIGKYMHENADIVAMCEVWRDNVRDNIVGEWPTTPHLAHNISKFLTADSIWEGFRRESNRNGSSGLMTISKQYPFTLDDFDEFQHEAGKDAKADKGILLTNVDFSLGESRLAIYNTHLQAGNRLIALKQALQIAMFISRTKGNNPSILVGDFNIDEFDETLHSTTEIIDVKFDISDQIKRAVRERVVNGRLTGALQDQKTAYQVLIDVTSVLGFEDLWKTRNGSLGYTTGIRKMPDEVCPIDPENERFCLDEEAELPFGRIDYMFVSRPEAGQTFTVDFSRPRRLRLDRDIDAPGLDEIAFLSDHIGLEITLLISPSEA